MHGLPLAERFPAPFNESCLEEVRPRKPLGPPQLVHLVPLLQRQCREQQGMNADARRNATPRQSPHFLLNPAYWFESILIMEIKRCSRLGRCKFTSLRSQMPLGGFVLSTQGAYHMERVSC